MTVNCGISRGAESTWRTARGVQPLLRPGFHAAEVRCLPAVDCGASKRSRGPYCGRLVSDATPMIASAAPPGRIQHPTGAAVNVIRGTDNVDVVKSKQMYAWFMTIGILLLVGTILLVTYGATGLLKAAPAVIVGPAFSSHWRLFFPSFHHERSCASTSRPECFTQAVSAPYGYVFPPLTLFLFTTLLVLHRRRWPCRPAK